MNIQVTLAFLFGAAFCVLTSAETCQEKHDRVSEILNQDPPPLGLELPNCEEDGSYKPVQCRGSQCYCVESDGSWIGYSVNRWEAQGMNCLCARSVARESNGNGDSVPVCQANGNYL